jgi:peptidoglycan biosynthesis protein MviN/MurJ (putative lipid II flippase)
MCLSNITGRTFYALKATRFLAVIGSIEAGAYVVYAIILAHQFGLVGIAWSYVIYFNLSLLWHLVAIRSKTGKTGGATVLVSFARTGVAAGLGATAAWLALIVMENPWSQLVCGGMFGLAVYTAVLFQFKSSEAWLIWKMAVAWLRPSSSESPLAPLLK